MIVVLVSDDNSYNLAKEVGREFLGELYRVDKNGLISLFNSKARML